MPSDQTVLELEPIPGEPGKAIAVIKPTLRALAIAKFGDWRPQAQALVDEMKDVTFDLSTPKGRKALAEALAKVRAPRYAAQHARDGAKDELKSVAADVVGECDAVAAFLAATEERLVKLQDEHKEAERKKAEEAAARAATFEQRITEIRGCADRAKDCSSDRIGNGIAMLAALPMGEAEWAEFLPQAIKARDETMQAMRELLSKAAAAEEQAARLRQLEEENAALRAQQAISHAQRPQEPTGLADEACRPATVTETTQAGAEQPTAAANAVGVGEDAKHAGDLRGPEELQRLMQDEPGTGTGTGTGTGARGLSQALASKPDAMQHAREAAAAIDPATAPTLKIGELNDRLQGALPHAPIKVSAEGLLALGFKRADRPGPACHYLASEWPAIKAALIKHLQGLQ